MAARNCRLLCGGFRWLEASLHGQLKAIRSTARLAPVAVVVPTEMLREHLGRRLAGSGLPHANIHFLTLRRLADRLAGIGLGKQGMRPEPRFAAQMVLERAVREHGDALDYFGPMADKEGFREALLATFRDLKNAGLVPSDLAASVTRMGGGHAMVLREKLHDVALLWEKVEKARTGRAFYDEADLFRMAAEEAECSAWLAGLKRFVLYGFYDFTSVQQLLLSACFRVAPSTVYFPYGEGEAFEYARPALEWLEGAGFERKDVARSDAARNNALASLQDGLFISFPDAAKKAVSNTDGVLIVSAPGEAREVEEIVREIIHAPTASGSEDRERIGILMRPQRPYSELLQDALKAAEIEGFFNHCLPLSKTVAGKGLLLLAELLGSPLKRTQVMDFLAVARLRPLDALQGASENPPVSLWNRFSIEAGIVEGRGEWEARLRRLAESDEYNAPNGDEQTRLRAALDAFRTFLNQLFDDLEGAAARDSWRGMADAVAELFRARVVADENTDTVLDQLATLAELDGLGVEPTPEKLLTLLRKALDGEYLSAGRFERKEPAVTPLMQARGVPFDVVILPGLVEKMFPQPARQDPIILDSERTRLVAALEKMGKRATLPGKARRRAEEKLLFALAVQSARRRLVLTFPRLDIRTARPKIPSYFLLRCMEAVTGEPFDFDRLDKAIRGSEIGRFVRMTRLDPTVRDRAVHLLEYDLSSLKKALQEGRPNAMSYLAQESPFFKQALDAETARYGQAHFTRYDAVVESPEVLGLLGKRLFDEGAPVSATRLEKYASCPFSYLLRYVLGIEPVDEPERVAVVSGMDRGSLVHGILWEFLSAIVREGGLPLSPDHWPQLEQIARKRFSRCEREKATGYPLTWQIETERILADLRQFLELEMAGPAPFRPAYFEVRFGMARRDDEESEVSRESPVVFDMGGGDIVRFRGKIDRIDVDVTAEHCRVVDYKTGRVRRLADGGFDGGRALQLSVYLLAAGQLFETVKPESAEYYYTSQKGGFKRTKFTWEKWQEEEKTFQTIVGTILDGIRSGRFYAYPESGVCRHCDYGGLCGVAGNTSFKWRADPKSARAFLRMAQIP